MRRHRSLVIIVYDEVWVGLQIPQQYYHEAGNFKE